ncbi:MAG: FAD-dependent oxidoreductase [Agathobacter sp.]|nr:FAD-dependent oxidoreductase [Agathobacter sp.]
MKTDKIVQELVDSYGDWMVQNPEKTGKGGCGKMTSELYPYNYLFSPIQVNRTKIKNRVVMAPMGNLQMAEETGRPGQKMLDYFFARAKGGTGLLTTGLIPVSHGIDHTVTESGELSYFPRIDRTRTVYGGWRDLAQGVHAYGSHIFVQLTAGLGRVGAPMCVLNEHKFPGSASLNPNFYIPELPSFRMSDHHLKQIVKNMGQAAADAKVMGLDGVYLHGHEGYLLEQMTNPAFNRRKLGHYADWRRFGIECVEAIRKSTDPSYPIMYRIDLSLALNETYGDRMNTVRSLKKFQNGRTIEDTLSYMEDLVKAGVDMFDVDLGCYDNWWLPHPPAGMPAGCFLEISRIAKEHFAKNHIISNAGYEVPIVAVGKLGYPDLAEKALMDGDCDMVMLGRPLLADAEWCNKAYRGDVAEIRPCIGCQEGCVNEFVEGGHIQCTINPRTGFEDVIPEKLPEAKEKKHIAVIGAGPAGMAFSLAALERGHEITLIEKEGQLGGKVLPGSAPKIKYDFHNYLTYLCHRIDKAKENEKFHLLLNTSVDINWLKEQGFDSIVFANGSVNIDPPFPGKDQIRHVQAVDLLVDPSLLGDAKNVVVVGGGTVGCETAYFLAYEHNCKVKVVEMADQMMNGVCTANRGHLIHYMEKKGVELVNCAKVVSFEKGKVNVARVTKNVPDPYNTWQPILPKNIKNPLGKTPGTETRDMSLEADIVVIAMGGRADDGFYFDAVKEHCAKEVFAIGDCRKAARVLEATRAALRLAMDI